MCIEQGHNLMLRIYSSLAFQPWPWNEIGNAIIRGLTGILDTQLRESGSNTSKLALLPLIQSSEYQSINTKELTQGHVVQPPGSSVFCAGFELAMLLKMTWKSWFSCLHFPSAGVIRCSGLYPELSSEGFSWWLHTLLLLPWPSLELSGL